ncbi:ATP-binding protein [Levilactobacillus suantsaiihabitans]|uniref:DNA repair ATPase n=1 Tax=Levilactobacillus suantsaiihabitans TaxID=2487722 RepID=A0A4Z0J9L7_9LACO|nr:AAA family ATPase [Levilactobacillus suantsaiihabitans]TGD18078.1 DNA repair ATPase [Levilactobacillus suantsaiihabitans]
MYLNRLTIYGFGHFHDRTFDLTPGLNYLLGANEAGKSTLTQFITAIFFGFPTKKHPALRYEPLDGSRLGGEIAFTQGDVAYVVSRVAGPHGGKVTLRDVTHDLALPAATLARLLAPVDAQLFTSVYAMNEPRLGTVFSASKQELIDRLRHVGAVGSDFWLQQAHQLDQQAEAQYKPQGRNPQLNQQLREHRELTAKLAKADAAYDTYWQLLQDQQTLRQTQQATQQALAQQRAVTAQLTQQAALWATYTEWRRLGAADQAPVSGFAPEDATQLEQLRSHLTASTQTLTQEQQQLKQLQQAAQLPPLFQAYLPVAGQVDPLLTQLPAIAQAAQDQQRLVASQRDLEARATALEQQYAIDGQMPRPFSLATTQQVAALQDRLTVASQKRRRLQQELNQLNEQFQRQQPNRRQQRNPLADKQIVWLAIGLVVLVGSLLLPGTLFKLVGALLGVAIGYYGVFLVDSSTPASRELETLTADIRDSQAQLREGGQLVDDLNNQLDAIASAHGLGDLPVAQWSAAQGAIGEWEHLTRQLETTGTQVAKAQQTVTTYLAQLTQALPVLAGADWATVSPQLTQLQTLKQSLATQAGDLATTTDRLKSAQAAVDAAQQALTTFLSTRNLRSVEAFYQRYQAQRERTNRQQQRAALAEQLGDNLAALQQFSDHTALTDQLAQAQAQQAATQQQLDQTTTRLATLAGQLAHLTASGTQATLRQKLANLETQMRATTQDWLVKRLTSQWIAATLAAASGDRLPQIVAQASNYYGKLTENRYTEIELTATTLRVRRHDGEWREVSQLSRGTAEQLDLAVKLAFAVVMNQQVAMPLVIDDGFVNFDAHRRQAAYALLAEISHTLQVIFLTADTTVEQLTAGKVLRLSE